MDYLTIAAVVDEDGTIHRKEIEGKLYPSFADEECMIMCSFLTLWVHKKDSHRVMNIDPNYSLVSTQKLEVPDMYIVPFEELDVFSRLIMNTVESGVIVYDIFFEDNHGLFATLPWGDNVDQFDVFQVEAEFYVNRETILEEVELLSINDDTHNALSTVTVTYLFMAKVVQLINSLEDKVTVSADFQKGLIVLETDETRYFIKSLRQYEREHEDKFTILSIGLLGEKGGVATGVAIKITNFIDSMDAVWTTAIDEIL